MLYRNFMPYSDQIAEKRLKPEETLSCFRLMKRTSDSYEHAKIRSRIIEGNMPLVMSKVKKHRHLNISPTDLIQEGYEGLVLAVDRFDVERGIRFSTYACYWIEQKMTRYARRNSYSVRMPEYLQTRLIGLLSGEEYLQNKLSRPPTDEELEDFCRLSQEEIHNLRKWHYEQTVSSLDDMGLDDSDIDWYSFIEESASVYSDTSTNPETASEYMHTECYQPMINELLDTLSDAERAVIQYTYGLHDGTCYTVSDIGRRLHRSIQWVSHTKRVALNKLREELSPENQYVELLS